MAHGAGCSAACGIFLHQESNRCLLHWQADSLPLSHQGSPTLTVLRSTGQLLLRFPHSSIGDFTFTFHFHALKKEMATPSSVLDWRIPGMGSLVGCRLWGRTESDTTEATQQYSSVGRESACNAGDTGSIPGSGRSPAEGNGNPLQYSCLENPMDRGAWQATIHGVARVRHDLAILPNVP